MESEGPTKGPETRILEAMDAVEPTEASAVIAQLTTDLHLQGINGVNLAGMWTSFKRLLDRRGYFVATPAQLASTLDEIEGVGEGFDLYDLASSLARYDTVRMECRGLSGHRALPELKRFASPCACTRPRKEK
jgi:hypothetical protein